MKLDASRVPLSVRKSNITLIKSGGALQFRYNDQMRARFYIPLPEDAEISVSPGEFRFSSSGGEFSAALYGAGTFLIRGNLPIEIRTYPNMGYSADFLLDFQDRFYLRDTELEHFHFITRRAGSLRYSAEREPGAICQRDIRLFPEPGGDGYYEVVFTKKQSQSGLYTESCPPFDACVALASEDFDEWNRLLKPSSPLDYEASFILWANTMAAYGQMTQNAICPGKNGMDRAWNHDCNLVALALGESNPEIAYEQFCIPLDYIREDGTFPDAVSPFLEIWNTVKGPLQGIFYKKLMAVNAWFAEPSRLRYVYDRVGRNTQWWLTGREHAPCYWHGNEAAYDNATCFDRYPAVQSPALFAQLAVQCEFLAGAAGILGESGAAENYFRLAKALGGETEARFFDGERLFVRPLDDLTPYYSHSFYPYHALCGGKYWSDSTRTAVIGRIFSDYLCDYGIVSEAVFSEKFVRGNYESYFRGSVWWHDLVFTCLSLLDLGFRKEAEEIARRAMRAFEKSGFPETFDAITGTGNCCAGYSAMAAAYLILSRQVLRRDCV